MVPWDIQPHSWSMFQWGSAGAMRYPAAQLMYDSVGLRWCHGTMRYQASVLMFDLMGLRWYHENHEISSLTVDVWFNGAPLVSWYHDISRLSVDVWFNGAPLVPWYHFQSSGWFVIEWGALLVLCGLRFILKSDIQFHPLDDISSLKCENCFEIK